MAQQAYSDGPLSVVALGGGGGGVDSGDLLAGAAESVGLDAAGFLSLPVASALLLADSGLAFSALGLGDVSLSFFSPLGALGFGALDFGALGFGALALDSSGFLA